MDRRASLILALGLLALGAASARAQTSLAPVGSQADLQAVIQDQLVQDGQPVVPCDPKLNPQCVTVDEVIVTGTRIQSAPSITNNQEVGVDEGDIVKARGDTLVVLRRGRLFSVSTAGGGLRAVDSINAYAAEVDPYDDWYDEMLVSGDWVVVIGYSYGRGGTEINRFTMDRAGRFTFVDSHHLSSEDYYSSRNYASRLIGEELVFYTPVDARGRTEPLEGAPTLSRWSAEGKPAALSVVRAEDIYRAASLADPGVDADTLHTVVRCDLTAPDLTCRGVAILGPESRNFYVAPKAVYVWVSVDSWTWNRSHPGQDEPPAWLYRIPLDGGAPQAAAARGVPIDQLSFREDPEARAISVMVVSDGEGEGMWGSERAHGSAALVTLPFERFGDGDDEPMDEDYRILPGVPGRNGARNRFVGDHLLYSGTIYNGRRYRDEAEDGTAAPYREGLLTIVPLNGGPIVRYVLPGAIGRIEEMGRDAMVVTTDKDMVFTTVALTGSRPVISDQFVVPGSSESESRSHAFYFLPDADSPDGARGVLGLPIMQEPDEDDHWDSVAGDRGRGAVAFMRRGDGRVTSLGSLDAAAGASLADDGCAVSCYGWYGDARPIFLNGRVFALLGYEIVEGRERSGRMRELRRIDMTPPTPAGPRPYYLDY